MSSGKLDKYKYLSGEDLKVKPDVIDQARFVASPLGRVCTKEWVKKIKIGDFW